MRGVGLVLAALLALAAAPPPATPPALRFGRFGAIEVTTPAEPSGEVVLLLAGASRAALAPALAARGALVLGFDPAHYLAALRRSRDACDYPAGELEGLSHFAQQRLGRAAYAVPYLVGAGDGAALAFAALAQAPPNTFRAALGLGFAPELPLARTPCKGHGLVSHLGAGRKTVELDTRAAPPAPFVALPAGSGAAELAQAFVELAARTHPAPPALHAEVSDLPLVEVAAEGAPADALAVILSGDGGWASIDRELGAALAARGIPVAGWNTLEYFWQARTPDEAGAALERVLRHYLGAWHKSRALLVGYSFGADVLPFLASRLPPDLRARVALVALLGPGTSADFEFHFDDWLGSGDHAGAQPIAPEVAKLAPLRVLCVYGKDEDDSLCPQLAPTLAIREERPGDHHFGGDYQSIAARIAREIE